MWFSVALLAAALAQDAPAASPQDPVAGAAPASGGATVVVQEDRIKSAKKALRRVALREGYHLVRDRNGRMVFRSDGTWKPDVIVYVDGRMDVRKQPVGIVDPYTVVTGSAALGQAMEMWDQGGPRSAADAAVLDATEEAGVLCLGLLCGNPQGQLLGPRKFRRVETYLRDQFHPAVTELGDAFIEKAFDHRESVEIPAELYTLWDDDTTAPDVRRARLYAWWDSRTDTPEGERARTAARAFILGVVQAGDAPFTLEELDRLNAARTSPQPLDLGLAGG